LAPGRAAGSVFFQELNGDNLLSMFLVHPEKAAVAVGREDSMTEEFEPVIIGFLCNWCAYAGGDLAGVSRLQYPPNMRAVRVMCTGMVHPNHVVGALTRGADGVLVMG